MPSTGLEFENGVQPASRLTIALRRAGVSWIQRPRFAMEAAYAGLLVIMLVLGAFSTPLAALPEKGLQIIQPEPDSPSVWEHTQESLGTFWDWVASVFEKMEDKPGPTEEKP